MKYGSRQRSRNQRSLFIFCDLSTPKGDGTFNVYEDIRNKLIEKGVPPEEIVFIHEANTELRKAELFGSRDCIFADGRRTTGVSV